MIPEFAKSHVERAVKEIEQDGVPRRRKSTKFCMQLGAKHYPPKYVLALAVRNATGKSLSPSAHSGGAETNRRLEALGLKIVECPCGGTDITPAPDSTSILIGRIIINGPPLHRYLTGHEMERAAENVLYSAFKGWPDGHRARFVITPGGFLKSELPLGLSGQSGWNSIAGDFPVIRRAAETVVRRVVTPRVLEAAAGKIDSLTIGIDLFGPEGSHAELVAFIRTRDGRILRWTGKSYPTADQEKALIQVLDLASHCLCFKGERVLILGCHDLNMFSPRGWANQARGGYRRKRCSVVRSMVAGFQPTVVLHHPHSTDSARIWLLPWASLRKTNNATLNDWASGICFYREGGTRGTLRKVATATRSAQGGLDFVFRTSGGRIAGPKLLNR